LIAEISLIIGEHFVLSTGLVQSHKLAREEWPSRKTHCR
jgi:hypothetical protein